MRGNRDKIRNIKWRHRRARQKRWIVCNVTVTASSQERKWSENEGKHKTQIENDVLRNGPDEYDEKPRENVIRTASSLTLLLLLLSTAHSAIAVAKRVRNELDEQQVAGHKIKKKFAKMFLLNLRLFCVSVFAVLRATFGDSFSFNFSLFCCCCWCTRKQSTATNYQHL